jgi:hypothetical protein
VVDQPAFTSQQNMDAACPVANARGCNFSNTLPFGTIVTRVGVNLGKLALGAAYFHTVKPRGVTNAANVYAADGEERH